MNNKITEIYFRSFMQNVMALDKSTYIRIVTKQISKKDFNKAVRNWAADITTK